jgi:hypothetical protein
MPLCAGIWLVTIAMLKDPAGRRVTPEGVSGVLTISSLSARVKIPYFRIRPFGSPAIKCVAQKASSPNINMALVFTLMWCGPMN